MTTITNTLLDTAGQAVSGVTVRAYLVPSSAFAADGTSEIIRQAETTSGADGTWTLTLTPQSAVEGTTYYRIVEGTASHTITVPDTGTHTVHDVLTAPVPATGVAVALTQATADTRYQLVSQRGQPSGYATLGADGLVPSAQLPAMSAGTASAVYPASGYGFSAMTLHPETAGTDYAFGSGLLALCRVFLPAGASISSVSVAVASAAATANGVNATGVYDDSGTLLASSADTAALMTSTGWQSAALTSTVAASADDRFLWLAVLAHYSSPGRVFGGQNVSVESVLNPTGHPRSVFLTGQTSLPASVTINSAAWNTALYLIGAA